MQTLYAHFCKSRFGQLYTALYKVSAFLLSPIMTGLVFNKSIKQYCVHAVYYFIVIVSVMGHRQTHFHTLNANSHSRLMEICRNT